MKKRYFALMLVLAMLLSGCAEPETADVSGTPEPQRIPETAAAAVPEERPVSMGRLEGSTYINEYTGYACNLDGGWTFAGAEELQQLPEDIHELIKDSEIGESMDVANQFTDMLAENPEKLQSINVLYQKQSEQERAANALYGEEEMMDGVLQHKDQMIEAYEQAGFLVENIEKVSVNFLGEQRWAIRTTTTTQGVPYITLQIFDYDIGAYSVTLTLASFVEDTTEAMLDLFYKVG